MKKHTIQKSIWLLIGLLVAHSSIVMAASNNQDQEPNYTPRRPVSVRKGKDDYLKAKKLFGPLIETDKLWAQIYKMVESSPGQIDQEPEKKQKTKQTLEKNETGDYLYFKPIKLDYEPRSYYLTKGRSERLDIQNWNVGQDGQYVQIQLQIGTGQSDDHSLASINVRKGIFYAPHHIMHCLLKSYQTYKSNKGVKTINTDDQSISKPKESFLKQVLKKGKQKKGKQKAAGK